MTPISDVTTYRAVILFKKRKNIGENRFGRQDNKFSFSYISNIQAYYLKYTLVNYTSI